MFSLFKKKQNQKAFELFLVQVTQFIETKVVSEETVFTEVKTFLIIINECPHRLIGLNC
ncbi:protein of unknown function [Vibrio tapetis subsp. tapetis]|uniref:Uncharacterized protein n=1 Tax=Vibrio tapetis subsp. tapetis TaxID=1671868 RepID=A0A2N8Z7W9_9VIBR|nr:protein of unknown function [Vibrio tapetis subsp. tapetis]